VGKKKKEKISVALKSQKNKTKKTTTIPEILSF